MKAETPDLDLDAAKAEILYNICNAPIHNWPFAHFYIDHVFPDHIYQQLVAHWPDNVGEFETQNGSAPGMDRYYLDLEKSDSYDRLSPEKSAFWKGFTSIFYDSWFLKSLAGHFRPYFNDHPLIQTNILQNLRFKPRLNLNNDPAGWFISPHTQTILEFLFFVFYLPDDTMPESYGTSVYVNKQNQTCPGGPWYPRELFNRVKTMPYRRNSGVGMVKNYRSFHGVEPHDAPGYRRTLFFALALPPDAPEPALFRERYPRT